MKIVLILGTLLLSSCAGHLPNDITELKSNFDNSTNYVMPPGFVYESSDFLSWGSFQLGLYWSSKYKDSLSIKARIPNEIINIESKAGLQFNIDKEVIKLNSTRAITDFNINRAGRDTYAESNKSFPATVQLLNKLIKAKSVKVKLITSKGFLEGDLKADKPSAAIRGFKEFMHKISTQKEKNKKERYLQL